MKAIMYHYIKKYDDSHPNFRFLDFKNFKLQLDFFDKNFGFVSKKEWVDFIDNGVYPNSKGKVILTFDDGLQCHYEIVFKELMRRGLWGIFYIPAMPHIDNKFLDVHRIHLLTGAFSGEVLFLSLNKYLRKNMIPDSKIEAFNKNTYKNQENLYMITEFKKILNYYISYEYRELLIDQISFDLNYKFNIEDFYIRPINLENMAKNGMIIGSHSYSHPVMSKLSDTEQKIEIEKSLKFLESINIVTPKTYCHPYGGFHAFNKQTIEILNLENVSYSFNVEPREISPIDIDKSRQHLPRFDCNLFPYGKAD